MTTELNNPSWKQYHNTVIENIEKNYPGYFRVTKDNFLREFVDFPIDVKCRKVSKKEQIYL